MRRRISDMICSAPLAIGECCTKIAEQILLGHRPVIFADHVLEDVLDSGKDHDALISAIPKAMPPFNDMLIEGRCDEMSMGVHAELTVHPVSVLRALQAVNSLQPLDMSTANTVQAFVLLTVYLQGQHSDHVSRLAGFCAYAVGEDYGIWRTTVHGRECAGAWVLPTKGIKTKYQSVYLMALLLACRTIGMMNMSNVILVKSGHTNDDISPRRAATERRKQIEYRVLRIRKGAALIPIPSDREVEGGNGCPLQLVRGHFKNYSEHGVFGKHKGEKYAAVWFPPHLRGSAKSGVIVKDYDATPTPHPPSSAHP